MIVREDGSTELVRKSIASDGAMYVPLDGSAKIVLVDNSQSFNDVPAEGWATNAVAFASSHELFLGTGDKQFSPDAPMTRGMLATVLYRMERGEGNTDVSMFEDVEAEQWYSEAVAWAAEAGIVSGYGDGRFGPNNSITREQLAVMLYRHSGSPAVSGTLGFEDAGSVSDWARNALIWAQQNAILTGYNNHVNPNSNASRAEVAQMLLNYVSGLTKK